MLPRFLLLVCLISTALPSLSQESGKANPPSPVTRSPKVLSKAGIVYVVGDVHRPMGVALKDRGSITVLEALEAADGPNPTASLHHARIIRKGAYGRAEIPLNLKNILQAKAADVTLQAEDILFVPRSTGKSAGKQQKEDFYDIPPFDPLQGPASIYPR